jgi:hypothetical protein
MSLMQLLIGRDRKASTRRRPRAFQPGMNPIVEGLERRLVLSASVLTSSAMATAAKAPPTRTQTVNVIDELNVTNVVNLGGTLNAVVALGNQVINVPIALELPGGTVIDSDGHSCPILDLHLGEIHLDLLGLNVDTSEICLSITAFEGGGLLGDLLCDVANLLDDGFSLGDILDGDGLLGLDGLLGGLTSGQVDSLLGDLTSLFNGALDATTTTSAAGTGTDATDLAKVSVLDSTPGACDILNLSLGPVDLTLLGLNVHLDNCNNGPVTVDITAVPGSLLGDLLCSLDDLLNTRRIDALAVNQLLTNIESQIDRLV